MFPPLAPLICQCSTVAARTQGMFSSHVADALSYLRVSGCRVRDPDGTVTWLGDPYLGAQCYPWTEKMGSRMVRA